MCDYFWSVYPQAAQAIISSKVEDGAIDEMERYGFPVHRVGNTAVIGVYGVTTKNGSWHGTSTKDTATAVRAAKDDETIENIVIVFDTAGGSVSSLDALGDEIAAAAKQKRVIAQVDGLLASAGYYAASHATEIRAGAMDLIGSIGTRITLVDTSKMYNDAGVKVIAVDTGEYKSAGMEGTEITKNHIADFQRIVDGYFADFKRRVMDGRGMNEKQFADVADGRVFFGNESVSLGLIDAVKTLDETMLELAQAGKSTQAARKRLQF